MYCIIVKRGELERYDLLYGSFGQKMPVLWERRHADRRKTADAGATEDRRQRERRGPPQLSWTALGFAVAQRNIAR